jgi:hypothetical protein
VRKLTDVIDQIVALLPATSLPGIADELLVFQAELKILKRTALYAAPEALQDTVLWTRLSIALYRYLPNPAGFPWAQQISNLVLGGQA